MYNIVKVNQSQYSKKLISLVPVDQVSGLIRYGLKALNDYL